ncbi:vetispiradiene synthase 2-like [Olea europaea subsp. europaea]|uniref:Vetispiradiene synthase 2-like n=1 Tax=Olea europaea subsp. europaea TaxID=158383 RepID=A0A8S0Q0R3_OLEEU|nr:vetispiradiene synthase 2-like [Olea europaea subsp. europaea]
MPLSLVENVPNCKKEIVHPVSNFSPSLWVEQFLNFAFDYEFAEKYANEIEGFKNKVRSMLTAPGKDKLETMNLIDTLECLGTTWLPMSCSNFKKFINETGKFKERIKSDASGLLSLYEAAYLRVHGEDILEDALAFTIENLKSMAPNLSSTFGKQVADALVQYIYFGNRRIEARNFISIYQEDESKNEMLLRWDISEIHRLPEYIKPFYSALLILYEQFDEELSKEGRSYVVYFAKEVVEKERGQIATGIESYMKENVITKEEAIVKFFEMATNAWKDIDEECLRPTSSSREILMKILNLEHIIDVTYKCNEDGYTQPQKVLKLHIISLVIDPIEV